MEKRVAEFYKQVSEAKDTQPKSESKIDLSIIIINNQPEPLKCFETQGFRTLTCNVEDITTRSIMGLQQIITERPIYFISPANSLLAMDGGIDAAYSRMFPGIQQAIQSRLNRSSRIPISSRKRKYLPVGASLLYQISQEYALIAAPTMYLPQNVEYTANAYWAMKAILEIWPCDGTLVVPMLGCGAGKIPYEIAALQMRRAVNEFYTKKFSTLEELYLPTLYEQSMIIAEQPKYSENREFFEIAPEFTEVEPGLCRDNKHPVSVQITFYNNSGLKSIPEYVPWTIRELIKSNYTTYSSQIGIIFKFNKRNTRIKIGDTTYEIEFENVPGDEYVD